VAVGAEAVLLHLFRGMLKNYSNWDVLMAVGCFNANLGGKEFKKMPRILSRSSVLIVFIFLLFHLWSCILRSSFDREFIQHKSRERVNDSSYLNGYFNDSLMKHFCFVGPHSRTGNPGIFPSPVCIGNQGSLDKVHVQKPIIIYNCTPDGNLNHAYHGDIYGFHFFLANCLEFMEENTFIGLPHLHSSALKKKLASEDNSWQTWAILLFALYSVGKDNIVFADSNLHCFPYAVIIDGGAWETYWTAPFTVYPINLAVKDTSQVLLQAPEFMKARAVLAFRQATLSLLSEHIPKKQKESKLQVTVYARMDTKRRIWRNYNETLQRLEKIDCINILYVDKMPRSFLEQVILFHQSDIFIAPHGAANVNAMFMKSGRYFIEIENRCKRTAGSFQWAFWHAPKVGVQMKIVSCRAQTYQKHTETYSEVIDFDANTDELINVAQEAILSLKPQCR